MEENTGNQKLHKSNGFLVIGRKINEGVSIKVGDEIVQVFLNRISGNTVSFAINAPRHCKIERVPCELKKSKP